ncbi:unnamed protein product [Candidula unifasciata]|uniref:Ribosomal protein eL8/eL30/eS12/Gadd45 domain-containing protein n=1 Tax=Candidula unifasciata TaxID=100452 RepID=A0A8S3ZZE8_9EUPU|nr:unnamed protein product [Candidula unifasciata]
MLVYGGASAVCSVSLCTVCANMGETLQEVVWQALEQGRLTCGVHDCAHQLEIDPYNVMLCVLPMDSLKPQDVSTNIHHMLIEAFCREYDIRLIKYPDGEVSEDEEKIAEFYKSCMFSDTSQTCLIALPD